MSLQRTGHSSDIIKETCFMLAGASNGEASIRYVVFDEENESNVPPASGRLQPRMQLPAGTEVLLFRETNPKNAIELVSNPVNRCNPSVQCEALYPLSAAPENDFSCAQLTESPSECGVARLPSKRVLSEENYAIALSDLDGFIRCAICDQRFTTNDYHDHVKRCVLEKPFKCNMCSEEYNKSQNLYVHNLISHSEPNIVGGEKQECPLCHKVFRRISSYYGHLNQHFVNETFSCSVCKKEFEHMALLNHHMRLSHVGADEDCFSSSQICTRCGIIVPDKDDMEKHILVHRKINKTMKRPKRKKLCNDVVKQHKCSVCEKSFSKLFELNRHMVVHTKEKRFECDQCGKKFSQKSSLRQHLKGHMSTGVSSYKCELCDAAFTQAGNLRRHVSLLHPADVSSRTVFRCPHCTCVFNSIQPLQVHVGKRHPDDAIVASPSGCSDEPTTSAAVQAPKLLGKRRLLCCSICGKAFPKSYDLVRHYRIHSVDRPFACNYCSQKFSLRSSLYSHLETHTRRDDSEDCITSTRLICSKQLATSACLKRHLKTHKALEHCGICDQSFASKKLLQTHQVACLRENMHMETCKSLIDFSSMTEESIAVEQESPNPYRCTVCSASFMNLRSMQDHLNLHKGMKQHFCRICAKSFNSLGGPVFKCCVCCKKFQVRANMIDHIQKQHNGGTELSNVGQGVLESVSQGTRVLENNVNDESGFSDTELAVQLFSMPERNGMIEVSVDAENYSGLPSANGTDLNCTTCPVCLFGFHSDSALATHLLNMITEDAHKYAALSCRRCQLAFSGCGALGEHMKSVHCQDDELSGTPGNRSGLRSVRVQPKLNQCKTCGRGFTKPCDLSRHNRIHTGEKPFKCEVCGNDFRVKSTLYQHMKVHSNERDNPKFVCSVCNVCYASSSALKVHLKTAHAEERCYKCTAPMCDQRFVTARQRDFHVRRVHIEHKGGGEGNILSAARSYQFKKTVAQLTPSASGARVLEQSQCSAFSRLNDLQTVFTGPTHIALKIRPSANSGNVEVQFTSSCGMIPDEDSIVVELSVLRPLVSEALLLKVPISTHFLSTDSSIEIDAQRVFKLVETKQTELMVVPLNAATHVTNLPIAVYADAVSAVLQAGEQSNFLSSCVICDETFRTSEQSEAHFQSEDHETAQLLSLSNLTNHLGSHDIISGEAVQYQPLPLRSAPTEICRLCSMAFESRESWLAHIRQEHERDDLELMNRTSLQVRRRTLN